MTPQQIDQILEENRRLKREKEELVIILNCHPALLKEQVQQLQDLVSELPSIDTHRTLKIERDRYRNNYDMAHARVQELGKQLHQLEQLRNGKEEEVRQLRNDIEEVRLILLRAPVISFDDYTPEQVVDLYGAVERAYEILRKYEPETP